MGTKEVIQDSIKVGGLVLFGGGVRLTFALMRKGQN